MRPNCLSKNPPNLDVQRASLNSLIPVNFATSSLRVSWSVFFVLISDLGVFS